MQNYKITHIFPNGEKRDSLEGCVLRYSEETAHIFDFMYKKAVEICRENAKKDIHKTA